MDRRVSAMLFLGLMFLPLASAVSLIRSDADTTLMLPGDKELIRFTVRGDSFNNTIEVFAIPNSTSVKVNGLAVYRRNYTLAPYESVSPDFLVEAVSAGRSEVEYGFRVVANGSATGVRIEQILKDTVEFVVSEVSSPPPPRPPRTTATRPSGGGGGGNVLPPIFTETETIPEPEAVVESIPEVNFEETPNDSPVNMESITSTDGAVNEIRTSPRMPVLAIAETGLAPGTETGDISASEQKTTLIVLLISSFGTAILGIAMFFAWRGNIK